MTQEIFDQHRFYKSEKVRCEDKDFLVHSVNFESGMIGIHNDMAEYQIHFSKITLREHELINFD